RPSAKGLRIPHGHGLSSGSSRRKSIIDRARRESTGLSGSTRPVAATTGLCAAWWLAYDRPRSQPRGPIRPIRGRGRGWAASDRPRSRAAALQEGHHLVEAIDEEIGVGESQAHGGLDPQDVAVESALAEQEAALLAALQDLGRFPGRRLLGAA